MIRVRELSKTTVAVAEELNIADRGGATYVDIIGDTVGEARSMLKGMWLSASQPRHIKALNEILNRMGDGDTRTSRIDERGDRIPG